MHKFTIQIIDNGELRTINGWCDSIEVVNNEVTLKYEDRPHFNAVVHYLAVEMLKVEKELTT
jgi:hypothetical protein